MNSTLTYNIPIKFLEEYRGRKIIVRSAEPSEFVAKLPSADPADVQFIQLLSATTDCTVLQGAFEGLPVEVMLKDPAAEFLRLYDLAGLLNSHPLRVTIPALPGFEQAVKIATSLNFAVKLQLDQPAPYSIDGLLSVIDLYLHRNIIAVQVEPFHSTLLSFLKREPVKLWEIAEEDPTLTRFVTDEGQETISRRFLGSRFENGLDDFLEYFGQELIAERTECHDCEFFVRCGGYFKWPDRSYRCDGVKRLFGTLRDAASEIESDLAAYQGAEALA